MGAPQGPGSVDDGHYRVTYEEIHKTIGEAAGRIRSEFDPHIMIAIGGGGFFPARVLRTFLKSAKTKKNIPIQAIGLSLYEDLGDLNPNGLPNAESLGKEVIRTQWLDFSTLGNAQLLGRRILIVDEVDDTRTTLEYAVAELRKDIDAQLARLPESERPGKETELAVFVVHNKLKEKRGTIPANVKYFSGLDIGDIWVDYPWECLDIDRHNDLASQQKALKQ